MIVVSEIGDIWSPHTAPAIHAEIEMILSGFDASGNTAMQIGINIPNVPHEVPVANARNDAITKIIAGKKFIKDDALPLTTLATKSFAPRESVMFFNVQARQRISIAGTIALNPSGIQLMQSVNLRVLLTV